MKNYLFLVFLSFLLVFSACGVKKIQTENDTTALSQKALINPQQKEAIDPKTYLQTLDEFAELERAGTWISGMGLTESGIRENAGDYAGAVAAAYKELSYAYGKGQIQKEELENGLLNVIEVKGDAALTAAANAVLAFSRGQWDEASGVLKTLFNQDEEPDSFANWMILVCSLEKNGEDRRAASAYKSIRARYAQYPEYWYRGAKVFSGAIAAEFAENCINLSSQGPFAAECRKVLASFTGINDEHSLLIKTKREIDSVISQSVNAGNPELIDSLLPLIGLPDNPYTVYAVSSLRALTNIPKFREYFNGKASSSSGRTAERLSYICRG